MCLLVNQPAGTKFDDAFLKGVYDRNSDGLGVMYSKDSLLHYAKIVPNTFEDFKHFYKEHIEGHDCAWHARMKTHGDIDLTNCHPYWVLTEDDGYPIMLMHNGVLSTGNVKDRSKSDTWHFINDYLRPMLLSNPTWFTSDEFAKMVSSFIGYGNKFSLMDAYGNLVTLNKSAGTTHEGAWLSNTYAWDAPRPTWNFNKGKTPGTSVKRAPTTVGSNSTSTSKPMYKADRSDIQQFFKDIKKIDNLIWSNTSYTDLEKLIESLGVWNTSDLVRMASTGKIKKTQFAKCLKDPFLAERTLDAIDLQRGFNFGALTL